MNKKAVIILSGGMDSTILTYWAKNEGYELNALSFDYGQKQQVELSKAKITTSKLNIPHQIVNLSCLGDLVRGVSANISGSNIDVPPIEDILGDPQPSTYVPNRNMVMLSIAMSFAEAIKANTILIGTQIHDLYGYWDTQPSFIDALNNVSELSRNDEPIKIVAPFSLKSKSDELVIAKELKVPLEDTWTCYDPKISQDKILACGMCGSCAERLKAFSNVSMIDPIQYVKYNGV